MFISGHDQKVVEGTPIKGQSCEQCGHPDMNSFAVIHRATVFFKPVSDNSVKVGLYCPNCENVIEQKSLPHSLKEKIIDTHPNLTDKQKALARKKFENGRLLVLIAIFFLVLFLLPELI